jgi:hypothetical protein
MINEPKDGTFEFTIKAGYSLNKGSDTFGLKVTFEGFCRVGSELVSTGQTVSSETIVPASIFKNEEQADAWANHAFRIIRLRYIHAALYEGVLLAGDEANDALNALQIDVVEMQDVIQDHIKGTSTRLQKLYQMRASGQPSQWTRHKLSKAVRLAVDPLPKKERTIAKAAERLKEMHPDKAPTSPAALRQMLSRFKIKWSEVAR